MPFAAVHESGIGTFRTSAGVPARSVHGGISDVAVVGAKVSATTPSRPCRRISKGLLRTRTLRSSTYIVDEITIVARNCSFSAIGDGFGRQPYGGFKQPLQPRPRHTVGCPKTYCRIGTVLTNLMVARGMKSIVSSGGTSPAISGIPATPQMKLRTTAGQLRHTIRSCGTGVTTAPPAWSETILKWSAECCPGRDSSIVCGPLVPATFSL